MPNSEVIRQLQQRLGFGLLARVDMFGAASGDPLLDGKRWGFRVGIASGLPTRATQASRMSR